MSKQGTIQLKSVKIYQRPTKMYNTYANFIGVRHKCIVYVAKKAIIWK